MKAQQRHDESLDRRLLPAHSHTPDPRTIGERLRATRNDVDEHSWNEDRQHPIDGRGLGDEEKVTRQQIAGGQRGGSTSRRARGLLEHEQPVARNGRLSGWSVHDRGQPEANPVGRGERDRRPSAGRQRRCKTREKWERRGRLGYADAGSVGKERRHQQLEAPVNIRQPQPDIRSAAARPESARGDGRKVRGLDDDFFRLTHVRSSPRRGRARRRGRPGRRSADRRAPIDTRLAAGCRARSIGRSRSARACSGLPEGSNHLRVFLNRTLFLRQIFCSNQFDRAPYQSSLPSPANSAHAMVLLKSAQAALFLLSGPITRSYVAMGLNTPVELQR